MLDLLTFRTNFLVYQFQEGENLSAFAIDIYHQGWALQLVQFSNELDSSSEWESKLKVLLLRVFWGVFHPEVFSVPSSFSDCFLMESYINTIVRCLCGYVAGYAWPPSPLWTNTGVKSAIQFDNAQWL